MSYMLRSPLDVFFFFFNDTATTEIYTLSLHDALPISLALEFFVDELRALDGGDGEWKRERRSEEHTSELQSPCNLVCRLLLEKKKKEQDLTGYIHIQPRPIHTGRKTPAAHST